MLQNPVENSIQQYEEEDIKAITCQVENNKNEIKRLRFAVQSMEVSLCGIKLLVRANLIFSIIILLVLLFTNK